MAGHQHTLIMRSKGQSSRSQGNAGAFYIYATCTLFSFKVIC